MCLCFIVSYNLRKELDPQVYVIKGSSFSYLSYIFCFRFVMHFILLWTLKLSFGIAYRDCLYFKVWYSMLTLDLWDRTDVYVFSLTLLIVRKGLHLLLVKRIIKIYIIQVIIKHVLIHWITLLGFHCWTFFIISL